MPWTKETNNSEGFTVESKNAEGFTAETKPTQPWVEEDAFSCTVEGVTVASGSTLTYPVTSTVVKITFLSTTTDFVQSDIELDNCTISSFSGSGTDYLATIVFSDRGPFSMTVPANIASNPVGKQNRGIKTYSGTHIIPKFIFTVQIPDQEDKTFALPILEVAGHTPSFNIDWGDETNSDITAHDDLDLDHTYSTAGTKTITIDGVVKGLTFANGGDKLLMREISNWGALDITGANAFFGCTELTVTANNAPAISTTTLLRTFSDCEKVVNIGTGWDVSSVQDFSNMFSSALDFNGSDLVNWDTSSATTMFQMFYYAQDFNQDISSWNTSNVTNMNQMFRNASSFNQPLTTAGNKWNVSSVTTLNATFLSCPALTAVGAGWDVSNVTEFNNTFSGCTNFNGSGVVNWDTSSGQFMDRMFTHARYFNQNIGGWNTSNVTTMNHMFLGADRFNQNIGSWNTGNVTTMREMFYGAYSFNQDIGSWNVSSVTDFSWMFAQVSNNIAAFNQDLGSWNVSSATTFNHMFFKTKNLQSDGSRIGFNNGGANTLKNWDVSSCTDFGYMFSNSDFNHPLSEWTFKTSGTLDMSAMFWGADVFNSALDWCSGTFADGSSRANNTARFDNMFYMLSASTFNQDIGNWNTSNATKMYYIFADAYAFNQNIGSWDTSSATRMDGCFIRARAFNNGGSDSIKNWYTSNVTMMDYMFTDAEVFNQPIVTNGNKWDVSNVTVMNGMFYDAEDFEQDLSTWDFGKVTTFSDFLRGVTFTTANYNKLLHQINASNIKTGIVFNGGASTVDAGGGGVPNGETARQALLDRTPSWIITDGDS